MRILEGGTGTPTLLLLHGLGATADVWRGWAPWLARQWPGRWVATDLPGHGGSPPLPEYRFDTLAAAVRDLIDGPTVVLGHSLGGVVGLTLASDESGRAVRAVVGLGIKVSWTDDDLARAAALARRPVTWFPSRDEAASRYLRVAGLDGLIALDDPFVDAGLRHEADGWRLALDPAAFGVGAPDLPALLAATSAEVVLARGEHDPMCTDVDLAGLDAPAVVLPGLGHNAHVEDPAAVLALLDPFQ